MKVTAWDSNPSPKPGASPRTDLKNPKSQSPTLKPASHTRSRRTPCRPKHEDHHYPHGRFRPERSTEGPAANDCRAGTWQERRERGLSVGLVSIRLLSGALALALLGRLPGAWV